MSWKIPGWAAAGGAVVSLAAGLAGGNAFGIILLRAAVSALVAGALGFAAQAVLRRFLPDLAAGAPRAPQPGVDILVDEEIPLEVGEAVGREAAVEQLAADDGLGLGDGLGELGPAEEEPFPASVGGPDFASEGPAAGTGFGDSAMQPEGPAGVLETLEPVEAEELTPVESLEALSAVEPDDGLSGTVAAPGHRSLKAEELEAQLDSVTKGQDPASLAKAVRTFLRKDQEG